MTNLERLIVLAASQKFQCVFCHCLMEEPESRHVLRPKTMTREHIVPQAYGGEDNDDNCKVSCNRCNSLRGVLPAELYAAIVECLYAEEGFSEHWHSEDPLIVKLLRKAVQYEVMRAYAYVCRETAFALTKALQERAGV